MAQEAAFAGVDALIARAALAAVPGAADGVHRVEPLEGGIVNRTWRVDTARGRFAVRICLPVDAAAALGVDRGREERLQDLAAAAGIAPRIVGRDPGHRYMVSEFVAGERWTPAQMRDPQCLRRLGAVLTRLHRLQCPDLPVQTVMDAVRSQAPGACSGVVAPGPAPGASLQRAEEDFRLACGERRRPCVVHGDAHHANVIGAAAPCLVDWEYAHVGDPLEELASIIASDPQAAQAGSREELLDAFGLSGTADGAMLDAMVRVFRCLNELWERRARGLAGPPR
jgi:aminoglycoside phosphotransferase (APT) family kinase protein